MPMVNMHDMLNHAYRNGYAVGGFDLVSLDFLEAIMAGAEAKKSPVILSLAESHFEFFDLALDTKDEMNGYTSSLNLLNFLRKYFELPATIY